MTISDGDRIPVTINASSYAWRYTRRSSLPDPPPPPGTHIYYDPNSLQDALNVPYSGNRFPPPNSLEGKYPLVDHYFVEESPYLINPSFSPPIHVRGTGLIEVEVTASNDECGCVTKVNNYLVNLPRFGQSPTFRSTLTISPNPADSYLNITIEVPGSPEEPEESDDPVSFHAHQAAS